MADRSQEISIRIKQHLAGRGIEVDDLQPTTRIAEDLDLDSLDVAELTLGLEEHFAIEIPDEELEGVSTIGDVVALIDGKLSVQA